MHQHNQQNKNVFSNLAAVKSLMCVSIATLLFWLLTAAQDWLSSQQPTEDAAPSPLPSHVDDDEVEENVSQQMTECPQS